MRSADTGRAPAPAAPPRLRLHRSAPLPPGTTVPPLAPAVPSSAARPDPSAPSLTPAQPAPAQTAAPPSKGPTEMAACSPSRPRRTDHALHQQLRRRRLLLHHAEQCEGECGAHRRLRRERGPLPAARRRVQERPRVRSRYRRPPGHGGAVPGAELRRPPAAAARPGPATADRRNQPAQRPGAHRHASRPAATAASNCCSSRRRAQCRTSQAC